MADVYIKFEREGVEGAVPTGTSLAEAGRRLGIRFDDCKPAVYEHCCSLVVRTGNDLLSPLTDVEAEHFVAKSRTNERLACEAKITETGEIIIMTEQNTEEATNTNIPKVNFQDDFNALPLDKKFATLLQLEVATLSEAFNYVAKTSLGFFEQIGVAISDFGTKVETEAQKACDKVEDDVKADAGQASDNVQAGVEHAADFVNAEAEHFEEEMQDAADHVEAGVSDSQPEWTDEHSRGADGESSEPWGSKS